MNEPAFPSHGSMGEVVNNGMTLRDYFAAKAMQAVLSSPVNFVFEGKKIDHSETEVSKMAYIYEDAMLKARGE